MLFLFRFHACTKTDVPIIFFRNSIWAFIAESKCGIDLYLSKALITVCLGDARRPRKEKIPEDSQNTY